MTLACTLLDFQLSAQGRQLKIQQLKLQRNIKMVLFSVGDICYVLLLSEKGCNVFG